MTPAILSGSIFGVSFNVTVAPVGDGEEILITGTAGGQPVEIQAKVGDNFMAVTGTLLGNPCTVTARDGG